MDTSEIDWGPNLQITNEYMYREILVDNTYEKFYTVKEGDVVLDIGSNVGIFPFSLQKKHPKRVVCVEPSLGLLPALEKNLSRLPFHSQIISAAMGKTTGFQVKRRGIYDHIFGDDTNNGFQSISLKELTKLCELNHVDFMKIDCEGGEYDVFTEENYDYLTKKVGYIVGEWHLYDIENGIQKWNDFVELYLRGKTNFRVFESYIWKEVTDEVLDPTYAQRYYDWWVPRGTAAAFAVYIDNRVAPWMIKQ